VKYQKVVIGA